MSLKNLQEVRLKGIWKELPETEEGFNKMYKEYGTDADAFKVSTEYQKGAGGKNAVMSKSYLALMKTEI